MKTFEVDDVPNVNISLWSGNPALYDAHALRRIAEELEIQLQTVPGTNVTAVIDGPPRRSVVQLDPHALSARRRSRRHRRAR